MGTTTATAIVPPLLSPLLLAVPLLCKPAVVAAEDEDDEEERVVVAATSGFDVDVTNVVIVDPPGAVDVITDVTIEGCRVVVGAAAVVDGSFSDVVVGAGAEVLVVGTMTELDVEVTLMTVGEVVVGSTTELVDKEVVSSVEVTDERGLLLAMELVGLAENTDDEEATEELGMEDADGV